MKKALLIGINDYPEGNELTGCIEDINSVKAAIERHGDGSPNFGVKMMPNVQTSGEVMDAIRKLFAGNDDTALFYFSGHGYMNSTGAVRNRSQVYNPKTEQWVKRDKDTGRFMDVKQDGTPFKGVRKEK